MTKIRSAHWLLLMACLLAILLLNIIACTQSGNNTTKIDKEEIISLAKEDMIPCERASAGDSWKVELVEEGKWLVIHECLETMYRGSQKTPVLEIFSHEEWYYYHDTGELVRQQ